MTDNNGEPDDFIAQIEARQNGESEPEADATDSEAEEEIDRGDLPVRSGGDDEPEAEDDAEDDGIVDVRTAETSASETSRFGARTAKIVVEGEDVDDISQIDFENDLDEDDVKRSMIGDTVYEGSFEIDIEGELGEAIALMRPGEAGPPTEEYPHLTFQFWSEGDGRRFLTEGASAETLGVWMADAGFSSEYIDRVTDEAHRIPREGQVAENWMLDVHEIGDLITPDGAYYQIDSGGSSWGWDRPTDSQLPSELNPVDLYQRGFITKEEVRERIGTEDGYLDIARASNFIEESVEDAVGDLDESEDDCEACDELPLSTDPPHEGKTFGPDLEEVREHQQATEGHTVEISPSVYTEMGMGTNSADDDTCSVNLKHVEVSNLDTDDCLDAIAISLYNGQFDPDRNAGGLPPMTYSGSFTVDKEAALALRDTLKDTDNDESLAARVVGSRATTGGTYDRNVTRSWPPIQMDTDVRVDTSDDPIIRGGDAELLEDADVEAHEVVGELDGSDSDDEDDEWRLHTSSNGEFKWDGEISVADDDGTFKFAERRPPSLVAFRRDGLADDADLDIDGTRYDLNEALAAIEEHCEEITGDSDGG